MDRKHCGKRRNCSLQAISPFPTVFSEGLFPGASKGVIGWEWVNSVNNPPTHTHSHIISVGSVYEWTPEPDFQEVNLPDII